MPSDEDTSKRRPGPTADRSTPTAAERLLRTLRDQGIDRVFANLGTDHAPLLEQASRLRDAGEGAAVPDFVVCPHEFAAMSVAHGAAETTGEPQAVLVHVDVGTQNLGAAMHNAHRSGAPILVIAGLAPVTDDGYIGSRNNVVHYVQDVFDQPGIVREYCRWTGQFQPPEDPAVLVTRALERAIEGPAGPVYLSATREALETPVRPATTGSTTVRRLNRPPAATADIDRLVELLESADRPLLVTGGGRPRNEARALEVFEAFAETAGAGVVEHAPTRLCFPRDHDLHVGYDPAAHFETADLVIAAGVDVPWVPWQGVPDTHATTVQIDFEPTKPAYPRWHFEFDETLVGAPVATLAEATDHLDPAAGAEARAAWRSEHNSRQTAAREEVDDHESADRLTPAVVSSALGDLLDDGSVVVNDATTSGGTVLEHVPLVEPGSYRATLGAGLGWGASAAVGVKLARPDRQVVATVGDGSYVFANPTACAWLAAAHEAPTVTVVYNNAGWNAVRLSTLSQHPAGVAATEGLPESSFDPRLDLAKPAQVAEADTRMVASIDELRPGLQAAFAAADAGTPAVVDVHVEPV